MINVPWLLILEPTEMNSEQKSMECARHGGGFQTLRTPNFRSHPKVVLAGSLNITKWPDAM
jgi:hypothetical protein